MAAEGLLCGPKNFFGTAEAVRFPGSSAEVGLALSEPESTITRKREVKIPAPSAALRQVLSLRSDKDEKAAVKYVQKRAIVTITSTRKSA